MPPHKKSIWYAPQNLEYVILTYFRDFADTINLKMLQWRDYPDYPGGPKLITGPTTDLSFAMFQTPLPSFQFQIMPHSFLPQGL